jgi:hypothetical protein
MRWRGTTGRLAVGVRFREQRQGNLELSGERITNLQSRSLLITDGDWDELIRGPSRALNRDDYE